MTEKYAESGVVEVANDKGKFQSIKFRGRSDWFSNWGVPLDVGAIIHFNFTEKGQFRNISNFELVNNPEAKEEKKEGYRNPEPDYKPASDMKTPDALQNLPEVIGDAKKILNGCKDAVKDVFDVEEIKPEHVVCINTLFIFSSKEVHFRR